MIDTKKIIVTGSNGFIGKHVSLALSSMGYKVYGYDIDNNLEDLKREIVDSSFLIHLAGINRPTSPSLFYQGHVDLTNAIVQVAIKYNPQIKIISNSSIQATLDNDYGRSKRTMEEMLLHSPLLVHIIRFYNVFGKWCRPNYNSVVATYCHNIAHDLPIYIDEPNRIMELNYIDDVVKEIINIIQNDKLFKKGIFYCAKIYKCSLSSLAGKLFYFKRLVESESHLPLIDNEFELDLFITFLDYLKDNSYSYNRSDDDRGYFLELYKNKKHGQISLNMALPMIVKGGHYHTYKHELFMTVIGECLVTQIDINTHDEVVDISSIKDKRIIKIAPYHLHYIKNIGTSNSYTIMWISDIFDVDNSDTYKKEL